MSSFGELFVDEDCRDEFSEEIDTIFPDIDWRLDGSNYIDCWSVEDLLNILEVDILDNDTDDIIGSAVIRVKFKLVNRKIHAVPYKISIKKIKR